MRLVMRERPVLQQVCHALTAFRGINGFQTRGKRTSGSVPAQCQNLLALQQDLNGSAQSRPEFYLSRNRPLHRVPGEARIEHKAVGKLHWLTHAKRVAYCYRAKVISSREKPRRSVAA